MQLQQSLSGGRFVKKFVMQGVEGLLGARARLAPGPLGAGGSMPPGGRQPGGRQPGGRQQVADSQAAASCYVKLDRQDSVGVEGSLGGGGRDDRAA